MDTEPQPIANLMTSFFSGPNLCVPVIPMVRAAAANGDDVEKSRLSASVAMTTGTTACKRTMKVTAASAF